MKYFEFVWKDKYFKHVFGDVRKYLEKYMKRIEKKLAKGKIDDVAIDYLMNSLQMYLIERGEAIFEGYAHGTKYTQKTLDTAEKGMKLATLGIKVLDEIKSYKKYRLFIF